jgi:hypothetical protein
VPVSETLSTALALYLAEVCLPGIRKEHSKDLDRPEFRWCPLDEKQRLMKLAAGSSSSSASPNRARARLHAKLVARTNERTPGLVPYSMASFEWFLWLEYQTCLSSMGFSTQKIMTDPAHMPHGLKTTSTEWEALRNEWNRDVAFQRLVSEIKALASTVFQQLRDATQSPGIALSAFSLQLHTLSRYLLRKIADSEGRIPDMEQFTQAQSQQQCLLQDVFSLLCMPASDLAQASVVDGSLCIGAKPVGYGEFQSWLGSTSSSCVCPRCVSERTVASTPSKLKPGSVPGPVRACFKPSSPPARDMLVAAEAKEEKGASKVVAVSTSTSTFRKQAFIVGRRRLATPEQRPK